VATFKAQIENLVGSVNDDTALTTWLTDGAKELINLLPDELKMECSTITALTSDAPMDLDASGKILHVTRENSDAGYHTPCRQIPSAYGGMASSGSGHMMYEPTVSDPVYWIASDTGGNPKLFIKPDPTTNQPAQVHHVAFPSPAYGDSTIANFPDEAEYLVVLYAAIKSAESLLASEEDDDLYIPIINTLKSSYSSGLTTLAGQVPQQKAQPGQQKQQKQMQDLFRQMLERQK
jgi:hypothetical protein